MTGYVGAITIAVFSLSISVLRSKPIEKFSYVLDTDTLLITMIFVAFSLMLITEFINKKIFATHNQAKKGDRKSRKKKLHLLISTLYRFNALLAVFFAMFCIVEKHPYFSDTSFQITRKFFSVFLIIYLTLGMPYIYFTLKYKSSLKYEYNDYSISWMLIIKGIIYFTFGKLLNNEKYIKRSKKILFNRRTRKIILTYLVIFFFSTLMTRFLGDEFRELERAVNTISALNINSSFFEKYNAWYLLYYHLLFIIDISLALIGYIAASRWLSNRTKSVDMTLGGWIVTLMCYPPINSGFTGKFINYSNPNSNTIEISEACRIVIMAITLLLIIIYVWSTITLSLKFSNLTNRGIVTTGPYSVVRHPAYVAKNLSWWLENSYVLSNFWSATALLLWNSIYILRALTEERHLRNDARYQLYCNKVKHRFIPGVF
ncbi:MAG: isoprenylcysteine carboxylmethyltransferase family protein [Chroococcidiopsidaceae cyanobacterium CP_BM_RX_35]|nr:isoprenylcysteine carboxylmethyltransferase family protein [Chroococcidiopsidaceae cyanobacterium CP_BM_RX_35]